VAFDGANYLVVWTDAERPRIDQPRDCGPSRAPVLVSTLLLTGQPCSGRVGRRDKTRSSPESKLNKEKPL
jgi:hypothetical protein